MGEFGIMHGSPFLLNSTMKRFLIFTVMAVIAVLASNAEQYNEMTYTKRSTTFTLVAQKAQAVQLNIYTDGVGGKAIKTVAMQKGAKGIWKAVVKGDLKGRFYTFNVKQGGKMLGETPEIGRAHV